MRKSNHLVWHLPYAHYFWANSFLLFTFISSFGYYYKALHDKHYGATMDYSIETSATKPTKAPDQFTVFLVGVDEYIFCPIRKTAYKVNNKPEEKVRQWWLYRLKEVYGYPFEQMAVEVSVRVGSGEAKKKADIVVYTNLSTTIPRIFIEVKKPK